MIQTVSDEIAESLGMDDAKGALVQSVADGSPADKAGIKAGDVIVTFDRKSVSEMRRLPKIVAETDIGKSVPVKVFRNGDLVTLKVKVGELKDNPKKASKGKTQAAKPTAGSEIEELGLVVAKINQGHREKYDLEPEEKGVVITSVTKEGSAAKKGLQAGMVITAVTQRAVSTPKDVQKAVNAAKKAGRPSVLLQVSRGGSERFIALKLED